MFTLHLAANSKNIYPSCHLALLLAIKLELLLNTREKQYVQFLNTLGRKEMFYLTTHSTHFILRLYGIRHMVKDHSDSEKGSLLPPHTT